jgi:hypothetical protein
VLPVTAGTVLVLPSSEPRHASLVGALANASFPAHVVVPIEGSAPLASRLCAAINTLAPATPLSFVAFGAACLQLPSIAFAQRSAHRRVNEYVLVDPVLPDVTDSWPDARVCVYLDAESEAALQARLRGWTIRALPDLADWAPEE